MEAEKKALVGGFQQLKTFMENKERGYREEVGVLKEAVAGLLQAADDREQEFDEEIKLLSMQIDSISNRYYENI